MSHLDTEIHHLKEELIEMHRMARSQMSKGKNSLMTYDIGLARDVIATEKRINAMELKIDRDCENILALFNPVAVDLRFVLAALKINSNLERIGDYAEGIARYLLDIKAPFSEKILSDYKIEEMYFIAVSMMDDALDALIKEDTSIARKVFIKDATLDQMNTIATQTTLRYIAENQEESLNYLNMLSIIRKMERVGDQTKNIAEEIIFFIEAKVLKHGEQK
jgi:phosphate transport system protein